jgi:hypothetical protein
MRARDRRGAILEKGAIREGCHTTRETVQQYGPLAGDNLFGALYAASSNVLYGTENASGRIFAFPIPSGAPYQVSDSQPTTLNDGARCVFAADPGAAPIL